MAIATLNTLLTTLQDSITSATVSVPDDPAALQVPGGISLFDTKNELFLSYLHNLVFLVLHKIRERKANFERSEAVEVEYWDDIVRTLVGLRLYSDKGVKPLENKLRYELDRVIQAAEDAAKPASKRVASKSTKKSRKSSRREENDDSVGNDELSGSEGDSQESSGDDEEEASTQQPASQQRANLSSLVIPGNTTPAQREASSSGAYRPPRIAPTAMPAKSFEEKRARSRPTKSRTMDDYIDEEITGAPQAMPSIGSNIVRSGQRTQTAKEHREGLERRNYEETNYVRLPALSKKEQRQREGRNSRSYGGEEWNDLGAGAERVMKSLDEGRKRGNKLEQSRKRSRPEAIDAGPNGLSAHERSVRRKMQRQQR